MSVAAVMLVRDEADIVGYTLDWLLTQVDHVYVADNRSVDGTSEILADRARSLRVTVTADDEVGYWQSDKTTALARQAHADGHRWVVPVDADELWIAPDGRSLRGYLASVGRDVQLIGAHLRNHVPTAADVDDPNPAHRIGWRLAQINELPKVACRAAADLTIGPGNHDAHYDSGRALKVDGLAVHHYTWRTADQYLRKIRNGLEAYAATDYPPEIGAHWRMFDGADDAAIVAHFHRWFWSDDPTADDELVYDPFPGPT